MHICTFIPTYLPTYGGAEIGTHEILRFLKNHTGHRYSVVVPTNNPDLPSYEIIDGIEVYRFLRSGIWKPRWTSFAFYGAQTEKMLSQLQPDILQISYIIPTGVTAWFSARRRGIPMVMTLVGNDIYDPFTKILPLYKRFAAYCIHRTPHIVASSTAVRNRLISHFSGQADTIRVIPYGTDTKRFKPDSEKRAKIRSRYNIPDDQTVILALQRLDQRKGIDIFLRAVQQIAAEYPNIRVLLAGRGPYEAELKTLSNALGIDRIVTFCGFVEEEEKNAYYCAADIFAMHSHYEGLGIVFAEASSTALPVITTRTGGTPDVVIDGQTGILVEPNNTEAFAQGLRSTLAMSTQERHSMGIKGRQHIVENLDLEVVSRQFLTLFETVK